MKRQFKRDKEQDRDLMGCTFQPNLAQSQCSHYSGSKSSSTYQLMNYTDGTGRLPTLPNENSNTLNRGL